MNGRKRRHILWLALVLLMLLVPCRVGSAAQPGARASGPVEILSVQEFVVSLHLSAPDVTHISGTLQYDTDRLILVNMSLTLDSPWQIHWSGNRFDISHPQGADLSDTAVLRITFRTESLSEGLDCYAAFADLTVRTAEQTESLGDVRWQAKVAHTPSRENRLQSLTVENGVMEPEFHPACSAYTVQVPYETQSLVLDITLWEGTTYTVTQPELVPGIPADVVIAVTAENGEVREYVLTVLRATPGSSLTQLAVDGFSLEPAFDPAVTEYTLMVPWDTQSVSVQYMTKDPEAQVQILGQDRLYPGLRNRVELTVTGSDGSVTIYQVHIFRPEPPETETIAPTAGAPEEPDILWQEVSAPWWLMLLLAGAIAGLGASFMWLHMSKRKGKKR